MKLGKERSCHIIYIFFFALLPLGRYSRFALACSPARSRKLRHFCFAKLQKRAAEQRVTFSRFPSLEKRKASKSMQTRLPCKHLVNFKHRSFLTLPFPLGTCLQREAFIQRRLINAQIKFLLATNQGLEWTRELRYYLRLNALCFCVSAMEKILTLYTLTAVPIFSILFSVDFLWFWQGELTSQSKHLRLAIISFILTILMNNTVWL